MLAPLQDNRAKQPTAKSASVPAPVKGWNAKDALADMPADSAITLDNFFPNLEDVALRRGHASHATGVGSGAVETVAEYAGPSTRKLLAASSTNIYDATSAGAASSLVSGLTNGRWQTTMFGTSGGNFLYFVNGADAPRYYDGSSFTTPSLTGVTATDIVGLMAHQQRLFFVFNNSMSFGYLPVVSVAGSVSTFSIGGLCKKGGYIMAAGSWTRDGGSGPDDVAVFITSEGEAILYSGNDPSTAADWVMVGVFSIGKPIGRRCMFKVGSELVIITQDGFVPLSVVLPIDRVGGASKALSDNIQNAVTAATRSYGSLFGWQCILYPKGSYALVNVPQSSTVAYQYVVNTLTGAWCRFTGQNAASWSLYNDDLYFGAQAGGVVYKADTGLSDNNGNIEGKIKPAFNYFGSKGRKKLFTLCRPLFTTNGSLGVAIDLNVDFSDINPTSVPTSPDPGGIIWGTSNWGEANWTGEATLSPWITVYGLGDCASPTIRCSTSSLTVSFSAYDMIWQQGNAL